MRCWATVRARAAGAGPPGRRAELHRRHRCPGGGRRGGVPPPRAEGPRRGLAHRRRFDYYCWDLYAKVGDFYTESPDNRRLQAETLHRIERATTTRPVSRPRRRAHRRLPPRNHGAARDPLRPARPRERHPAPALLEPGLRAAEAAGAIRLESGARTRCWWVLSMEGGEGRDEDKILVRSNGTVTYTGKDIALPALEARPASSATSATAATAPTRTGTCCGRLPRRGRAGAPVFGHARAVYNVIDVGQSYPQRVVKAGVAALGTHAADARGQPPSRLREGGALARDRRRLGYDVRRRRDRR